MNILLVNKFHFIKGGSERHFFELKELLENKGHSVTVFSMQHEKNLKSEDEKYFVSQVQTDKISFSWQGVRTVARFFWSFEARRKVKRLLKDKKIDVVHLHNFNHQISPSILSIFRKKNIPVIMTVHDYSLISPNANLFVKGKIYDKVLSYRSWIKDRCVKNSFWASLVVTLEMFLHHKILNVYKKNINKYICPSKFMANKLVKAGFDKDKVEVLNNFVNPINIKNRQNKEEYILHYGRLSAEKGIDILIKAMKGLPNIKLKIVGTGPQEKELKQIAGDNIEFVGYKQGDALMSIVSNAKFVVIPSIWYENYPYVVLESHILGVPTLLTNTGGLPEMVTDKENFLFKLGDVKELQNKISSLWNNQTLLDKTSKQVVDFVKKNNSSDAFYNKLIKMYQK